MKAIVKSVLMLSLLSMSISSFSFERPDAGHQQVTADFSEKKQRQSSMLQLVSFMQDQNSESHNDVSNNELILQSIQQNSLSHKKLPEHLIAVR
ncbi:hypothetical protein [Alteromonas ponticola]|uniref:Uncharacterized protein n=1 Tax=Alteromonas ponticola TaxID=2720613 RepID=A0ABX1R6S8_9ALTE|nr:hypothetical protein [Alteromonas ponticola]NMH61191.1 hypothetical protein [Alteromonas ponticola]